MLDQIPLNKYRGIRVKGCAPYGGWPLNPHTHLVWCLYWAMWAIPPVEADEADADTSFPNSPPRYLKKAGGSIEQGLLYQIVQILIQLNANGLKTRSIMKNSIDIFERSLAEVVLPCGWT